MTKDELLKYAKENYPVGTKYKCPQYIGHYGLGAGINIVESGDIIKFRKDDEIDIYGKGYIYYKGKSAEILEKPKVETKFEKGKWYKNLGINENYIAKFKKIEKNTLWVCESYIYNNSFRLVSGDLTESFSNAVECHLEEIQQYLPAGHPDKIKQEVKEEVKPIERWSVGSYVVFLKDYGGHSKGTIDIIKNTERHYITVKNCFFNSGDNECNLYKDSECKWFPTLQEAQKFSDELLGKSKTSLRVEDLVEGEIYIDAYNIIFMYNDIIGDKNPSILNNKFYKSGGTISIGLRSPFKVFNNPKWLKTCIKQDKFIEQSELDKYDDEGNLMEKNEEYPEYVECIYSTDSRFTVNKIYKVESRKESCLVILSNNGKNENTGGYPLNGFLWKFKPSTKEAYEAKFKKDDKFKNGDWLVYIGDCGCKPTTPIKIGDVRQMIEGRFGSLSIYGTKDLSQYFRRALPHEIPVNNSIKEAPKLVFPYKVGDRIRCIKLNTWSSFAYFRCPLDTCENKIVGITKVGVLNEELKSIPFAATYNGVEYGFSYSDDNKYELVESFEDVVRAEYIEMVHQIDFSPVKPEEYYLKKQEVKNPLDDSEREVNINFSKPKQIKFL